MIRLLSALALLAIVLPPAAYAAENLPEYAEYAVCITRPDPRATTDPDHFAGSALGFVLQKDIVTNAIPHWHLQDVARDLEVPVDVLVSTLVDAYTMRGECALFNFYRSDDEGGTHHNAFFPYGAGATPKMLTLMPLQKAAEFATGGSTEYLLPDKDQEAQAEKGMRGVGQTNSDQGKKRGEE